MQSIYNNIVNLYKYLKNIDLILLVLERNVLHFFIRISVEIFEWANKYKCEE